MTRKDIEEAEVLFQQAMKKAGLRFSHYGVLEKHENNLHNVGMRPWLALAYALVKLSRERK